MDQCIWGCRETATGSDVNKMQALEDEEEHGAGLKTATQQKDCDTSYLRWQNDFANKLWKLTMIQIKNPQIKIKYHSRALQF